MSAGKQKENDPMKRPKSLLRLIRYTAKLLSGFRSKSQSEDKALRWVMLFFYLVISLALICTGLAVGPTGNARPALAAELWAIACLSLGTCVGFLFGIPKIFQEEGRSGNSPHADQTGSETNQRYRPLVNTNLIEISDWLTKIIVGLGLINLKTLPGFILGKAQVLATSLGKTDQLNDYLAFSVALIVAFPALGFLFGYLSTRLYLASAFARADIDAMNSTKREIESTNAVVGSLKDELGVLKSGVTTVSPTEPTASEHSRPASPGTAVHPVEPPPEHRPTDVQTEPLSTVREPSNEERLASLAAAYNSFESTDDAQRAREQDRLAWEMASLLDRDRRMRGVAFSKAWESGDNGYIAGLATAVNAGPEQPDLERLFRLGPKVRYKHCRLKVVTAIGKLFLAGIASTHDIPQALQILNHYYRDNADDSLRQRIREVLSLISQTTGRSVAITPP
jgi:hypothetical protein